MSFKSVKSFISCFECAVTNYFNIQVEEKSYSQTTRVHKKEALSHVTLAYSKHRFFFINDKIYWPRFLENRDHHVLWLHYSQNIALSEKMQV